MEKFIIGNKKITLEDLINVTRNGYQVEISEEAYKKVDEARALVDRYVKEKKVSYGITTGFGKFSDTVISEEETGILQRNLIMSHSCGVGNPIPLDAARLIIKFLCKIPVSSSEMTVSENLPNPVVIP